jgi:ribosomal protein L37AE/L43A
MAKFEWWCQKCKKFQPGSFTPATEPLAPGQDPPRPANLLCPVCGTKMMPRPGQH